MEHYFLQFVFVLTAITFISLFWASSKDSTDSFIAGTFPSKDSIDSEQDSEQRKSDNNHAPGSSNNSLTSNYQVLGIAG